MQPHIHAIVYPSAVPKDRLPIPKADLKTVKRKGLVTHFRFPTVLSANPISIGKFETPANIDNPDTHQISELTGENGWVKPQEGTHLSIQPHADESALDSGPSDSLGAEVGLSNPGVTGLGERHPALPLHDEVGPSRMLMGDDASVDVGNQGTGDKSLPTVVKIKGMRVSPPNSDVAKSTFYVDSGAGQCLSSCSTAFMTLEPCTLEVVGVAGSLPIFGRGTAIFVLTLKGGEEILVRIHNCLYSFGEFNLISVSQMQTIKRNTLNLSLESPRIRLYGETAGVDSLPGKRQRHFVDIPLSHG
jgi:hypothetical protein